MNIDSKNHISIHIDATNEHVTAHIDDRRPEFVDLFQNLGELGQVELASNAWTIGLRALANARAQAREARLHEVGEKLLNDFAKQLDAHVERHNQTLSGVLNRYFDPDGGQVMQRLDEFVSDQGPLGRLLESHLGPRSSTLAETLAQQVGQGSELFKLLSPTDTQGVVHVLETRLRDLMGEEHARVLRTLDPSQPDSAVGRFLATLQQQLQESGEDRAKQLSRALAALDANDESSLLSRLMRETREARDNLLAAVNPEAPGSPLATIRDSLMGALAEHGKEQKAALEMQAQRQEQFEKEVREALARIETRRREEQTSPRGGLVFEDEVVRFVHKVAANMPCVVEATGTRPGLRKRKIGDAVATFTQDSAFQGASVVFEAKRDAGYTVKRALDELDAARENRAADVGVFVMARSHAPKDFPRFARYGRNVLVIWDDDASGNDDALLEAAILLGLGLVAQRRNPGDEGNIQALNDLEARITREITRLDSMAKHTETLRKTVDKLDDDIRKGRRTFEQMRSHAHDVLRALSVAADDERAERATPIVAAAAEEAA